SPAKAGAAATLAVAATAGLVWALSGDPRPVPAPDARPPVAQPVVPRPTLAPPVSSPRPEPPPSPRPAAPPRPAPAATPPPAPTVAPEVVPSPAPTRSAPRPAPTRTPSPTEAPPPPAASPTPPPVPPPAPATYRVGRLAFDVLGDHTGPELRLGRSSWVWQRGGMSVGGTPYGQGITVHPSSSVVVDLNRRCSTYTAFVGVDDMTRGVGSVRFSVYADGVRLWRSPVVDGGDPAVPVRVDISGRRTIRLVTEPGAGPLGAVGLADWADAGITCAGGR
uniref:NPCBM/NEW2 domain-containing protein n=1 Tax=Streptomyces sp. DH12 TaxID=2857010 RepID=UPI001E2A2D7E